MAGCAQDAAIPRGGGHGSAALELLISLSVPSLRWQDVRLHRAVTGLGALGARGMRGKERAPDLHRDELSSAGCSDSRDILRKSFSLCSRGAEKLRRCIPYMDRPPSARQVAGRWAAAVGSAGTCRRRLS